MSAAPVTVGESSPAAIETPNAVTLLQRVIMPRPTDPSKVRTLYLDEGTGTSMQRAATVLDRRRAVVPAGTEVSFATYFNALPASYWRRWTTLTEVVLALRLSATCRIDIYRSKADSDTIHVTGDRVPAGCSEFVLDLGPFEDGGWYWFEVSAGEDPVTIEEAGWYALVAPSEPARLAIGICTFNRPADCVAALRTLAEDPIVRDEIDRVFVADQGTQLVRDADGFAAAQSSFGERLVVHRQSNLGGSGGFSRTMYEFLTASDATHLIFLDDDIELEPDSVHRAFTFARFAKHPMLVGGQMFALQDKSVLHSMGEVVHRGEFFWRQAPKTCYGHDFSRTSLRKGKRLHRRIDVDYNGWWMCLIPRAVAEQIGLPLPLFIKWDDAEYGLRAGEAGFPTATLPGVAIWHLSWTDKEDVTDWQAYFHVRNRFIAAALHSPFRHGKGLVRENFKTDLKYLLLLQYSAVSLRHMAMEDFLRGPDQLFDRLATALPEVRERRAGFLDGQVRQSSSEFPLPSMDPVRAERLLKPPTNPVTILSSLLGAIMHSMRRPTAMSLERPQLNVSAQDARWFLLARLDSATVGTADGRGVTMRHREPRTFARMLRRSLALHRQVYAEFPKLRRQYKSARPSLTSLERWRRVFERVDISDDR
ncbi:MAG: galactofuranosyltransferase GlfT2 [Geodermatophilaceae bacterium]|nr:galactofuranosyltransferase GlfT2 [Geodermatophilaceae bacterium]